MQIPQPVSEMRWQVIAVALVCLIAVVLVPLQFDKYVEDIVFQALILAILAISWNLLAGYAGQISLGHAAFFGVGAYVSAWLTTPTVAGLPGWLATHVIVSVLLAGAVAALVALVTGPAVFRLSGHYFAIGTLALAAIIQILFNNTRSLTGGATGYYVQNGLGQLGIYYVAVGALILTYVVTRYLLKGRLGLGMQAVRDDADAADSLGVHPLRYKMWAFIISSFFAGVAGALYGQYTLYLNASTTLGVNWTIDSLIIVILGGMGTLVGPLFGTGLFVFINRILGELAGGLSTTVQGVLIILFVIFVPQGIYGYLKAKTPPDTLSLYETTQPDADANEDTQE